MYQARAKELAEDVLLSGSGHLMGSGHLEELDPPRHAAPVVFKTSTMPAVEKTSVTGKHWHEAESSMEPKVSEAGVARSWDAGAVATGAGAAESETSGSGIAGRGSAEDPDLTSRLDRGFVLWLTGLSGAGKSTVAELIEAALRRQGYKVELLDGDEVRTHLSKGLGFSREDRDTNVKRIAYVAGLLARHGVICLTATISPYREARAWARQVTGRFVEVYIKCPLEVCAERDVKGLYARALAGEIPNFTGISDPYEAPEHPDIVVDTSRETAAESADHVLIELHRLGYLDVVAG